MNRGTGRVTYPGFRLSPHITKRNGKLGAVWEASVRKTTIAMRMHMQMSLIGKDILSSCFPITKFQQPRTSSSLTQLKCCLVVLNN